MKSGLMSLETYRRLYQAREKAPGFFNPDRSWRHHLAGRFRFVFVDEAQSIRKTTSQIHVAVSWLEPEQYHLTTATPIWNNERDLRGPLGLLTTSEAKEASKGMRQQPWWPAVQALNPFSDDGQDAIKKANGGKIPDQVTKGLLTLDAFDRYVRVGDPFDVQRNAADMFMSNGMIRHTYSSSIPHGVPEHSIGASLPKLYRRCVTLTLPQDQKNIYINYAEAHKDRLRMQIDNANDDGDALGINRNAVRALVPASGAPFLFLVGINRNDPVIDDLVDGMDARRNRHVKQTRKNAAEQIRKRMVGDAQAGKIEKWSNYPNMPERGSEEGIPDSALPSEFLHTPEIHEVFTKCRRIVRHFHD
jgi:hypothetical protein